MHRTVSFFMIYICNGEGGTGCRKNLTIQLTLTIFFENMCEFHKMSDMGTIHLNTSSLNYHLLSFLSSNLGYANKKVNFHVKLLHHTKQQHHLASVLFPGVPITYFHVLCIRKLRISTTEYSKTKNTDDSNIIFRQNNISIFGRVVCIFSVENREPLMSVNYLEKNPLLCTSSLNSKIIKNEHIRHGDGSTE